MTVNATTSRNVSTAVAGAKVFPYTFKILDASHLQVIVNGVTLTLGVDYTVDGVGNDAGGNATLTTALSGGQSVVLMRNMPYARSTDFQNLGDFLSTTVNADQDAPVLMIQQLAEAIARALVLNPASALNVSGQLPLPTPGNLLGWNSDGTGLVSIDPSNGGSDLTLRTQLANATRDAAFGAKLVGYTGAGASSQLRTVQDGLRDRVSVLTYCKGDGVTDDGAQLQACVNENTGKEIWIPAGVTCVVGQTIRLPSNTHLRIDGTIFLKNGTSKSVVTIAGGSSNVTIDGFGVIDANRANQDVISGPHPGLYIEPSGANNIRIRNITITNAISWAFNAVSCYDVIVERVTTSYSGASTEFAQGCHECWFINCHIHHIDDYGLCFYGGCYNCGAVNCTSHDNGAAGIAAFIDNAQPSPSHDLLFTGNISYNNKSGGIEVLNNTSPNNGLRQYNITIANNTCHHNGQANSGVGDIRAWYCNCVVIANNTCHESGNGNLGAWGISLQQVTYGIVSGNLCWNEGQGSALGQGLSLALSATNLQVFGNQLFDSQGTPTTAYHINGSLGPNVSVHDNFIGANSVGVAVNLTGNDSSARLFDNPGWNPTGPLTSPSLPASTVGLKNPFLYPVRVVIYGGTVSQIGFRTESTSAVMTNLTSGAFTLQPGEYIVVSYSVAPTWKWYGL